MKNLLDNNWKYESVPSTAKRLYHMCWQLETWLRTIIYVELRAERIDWETPIQQKVHGWPPASLESDKRLHHMATPHQAALSYLTFGQLWSVISDENNWLLFKPYFPPKKNTDVRIEEVKAIRNRVAHFRKPHPHDIDRLILFVKDLDPGIHRFCSRYTTNMIPSDPIDDPVSVELDSNWEQHGYGIELLLPKENWLYASEPHRLRPILNARLAMHTHKNYEHASLSGVIYSLNIYNRSEKLDFVRFYEQTKSVHSDIIHIMLSQMRSELTVTIPAVYGPEHTAELVRKFLSAGLNCSGGPLHRSVNHEQWPEYVLCSDHVLTFYSDDIHQPILEIE